jgi:hypothetical protein
VDSVCLLQGLSDALSDRSITFIHSSLPAPNSISMIVWRWAIPDIYGNSEREIPQKPGRLVLEYKMSSWQDDIKAISLVNGNPVCFETLSQVCHLMKSEG